MPDCHTPSQCVEAVECLAAAASPLPWLWSQWRLDESDWEIASEGKSIAHFFTSNPKNAANARLAALGARMVLGAARALERVTCPYPCMGPTCLLCTAHADLHAALHDLGVLT